jgi:uncharacterized protein (TIGR02145 family)
VEGTEREHYERNKPQFCDSRDGKKYVYVTIGEQTWMAENLNYNANGSRCNSDSEINCTKYGRLYSWTMAMENLCPIGWHIPSNAEWSYLMQYVNSSCSLIDERCANAGKFLKAINGWNNSGNGTDDYGFSALPGGAYCNCISTGGYITSGFKSVGFDGYWWSASVGTDNSAYACRMEYNQTYVTNAANFMSGLYSVRCLKD